MSKHSKGGRHTAPYIVVAPGVPNVGYSTKRAAKSVAKQVKGAKVERGK